jgi:hypothetical protein
MKLKFIWVGCIFLSTGCVNIKAPDNLLSDTVSATKDIYHSVKSKVSKDNDNLFSISYEIPENEALSISNGKCLDAAIEKAKKALNKYNVDVKETESKVTVVGGKSILNCSVSI